MSTLTQDSLEAALQQIRKETEKSISELREEMHNEVKSMEQNIAATVIAAIKTTQPINMEVEQEENRSIGSSSHDTAATIKSMMDCFDALTQVVQNLAIKVSEIVEVQEASANKRSRSPDAQTKQSKNAPGNKGSRSPPAKVPRPTAPTPPSTPPPKGHPGTGSREAK
jgi:hypothetical protein